MVERKLRNRVFAVFVVLNLMVHGLLLWWNNSLHDCAGAKQAKRSRAAKQLHGTEDGRPAPFTFLLIVITTRPPAFRERQLIRCTWYKGYNDGRDVMLRFAVGTDGSNSFIMEQLDRENNRYKDIVYLPISDGSAANMTLALMQWARDHITFFYLLKCSANTFVSVHRVMSVLRQRSSIGQLHYGVVTGQHPPNDTMCSTACADIVDGAYIISADLVGLIVDHRQHREWGHDEATAVDKWLTGYTLERRHDELMCYSVQSMKPWQKCTEINKIIVLTFSGLTAEQLRKAYIHLKQGTFNYI